MERQLINAFIWIKVGRMMWAKNKSTTPTLAFPFALYLNKIGSFSEKVDMRFGGSQNKVDMLKWGSRKFPKCYMTHFWHVLTFRTCRR